MIVCVDVAECAFAELDQPNAELLQAAFDALDAAYAPYSSFRVAASVRLANGQIITGTNQENASYPIGICAERVALSAAQSLHPNTTVLAMAVAYRPPRGQGRKPLAPCGMCRQALVEQHVRQKGPLSLVMAAEDGPVWCISDASKLLPLAFTPKDLD